MYPTFALHAVREKKLAALLQRQDRFLYIATALLLNLAEDTAVEKKMKKKVCDGAVTVV